MKMFPKYGLFDFFEFKSVEVVLTDNIHWCDDKSRSSLESGGVVTKCDGTNVIQRNVVLVEMRNCEVRQNKHKS